jgi:hypothetical protein
MDGLSETVHSDDAKTANDDKPVKFGDCDLPTPHKFGVQAMLLPRRRLDSSCLRKQRILEIYT